jgi:hypothetical protein
MVVIAAVFTSRLNLLFNVVFNALFNVRFHAFFTTPSTMLDASAVDQRSPYAIRVKERIMAAIL